MKLSRRVGKRQAHVLYHHLRHIQLQRMRHQQRRRAAGYGLGRKAVRVHLEPGRAHEQVARLYLSGINADIAYFNITIADNLDLARDRGR